MGNSQSGGGSTAKSILPSLKLKWKSGYRDSPLPYAHAKNKTYEDLCADESFRYFVYSTLHNEYIINALLADYDHDDLLIEGIDFLRKQDDQTLADIMNEINIFEKVLGTDARFNLADVLKWNESSVQKNHHLTISPFFKSFQKRMAVIRAFEASISTAKSQAQNSKVPREYNLNCLHSNNFPQILPLDSLKSAGVSLLKSFPILFNSIADDDLKQLLLAPVKALCEDIGTFETLSLYSSWAPRTPSPKKCVVLRADNVYASTGDATKAIEKQPNACWICTSRRGVWSVRLDSAVTVSDISVSWASSTSPANCGAPESVIIYIRKQATANDLVKLKIIDVDEEYILQGNSWTQSYSFEKQSVTYIELHVKGIAAANHSNCIKMYDFQVMSIDSSARCIDSLSLCSEMQDSLSEISKIPQLQSISVSTILSILRSTASLGLIIKFATFILEDNTGGVLSMLESNPSFKQLLDAILDAKSKTQKDKSGSQTSTTQIAFDEEFESTQLELLEDNTVLRCIRASQASPVYAQLSSVMSSGVWQWELLFSEDIPNNTTCAFGVGVRPIINLAANSPDVWLIHCSNTATSTAATDNMVYIQVRQNDVCRLTFDAALGTLKISVNDIEQSSTLGSIPAGVSPLVVFYDCGACRLLSMKNISSALDSVTAESRMHPLSSEEATGVSVQSTPSKENSVAVMLRMIADIAKARLCVSEGGAVALSPCSLESPFAIEVSKSVIDQIFALIQLILNCSNLDDNLFIPSLLLILEAQFSNLGNVDSADVGYSVTETDANIQAQIDCLNKLMECESQDIQIAAAKVFARGSSIFMQNVIDRVALASTLLNEFLPRQDISLEDPKFYLLNIVLSQLSSYSGVLDILAAFTKDWSAAQKVSTVYSFCSNLLEFVTQQTLVGLKKDSISTQHADFKQTLFTFLIRMFEMLCIELVQGSSVGASRESISSIFLHLFKLVVQDSRRIIATLTEISPRQDRLIDESILTKLLHPLLHVVCFCSNNLHLIQSLYPFICTMLKDMAVISDRVTKSVEALTLYNKSLPITNYFPLFEGGNKGWHPIAAYFESDSSYTLEDSGALYESVTSSNTCAVLNVTFCSPQRAAWEFELVGDSSGDECSVFGAAQIPFSSRCYSSSPDLWMRRSYNGYMYNRGRTSETGSMEKIHPGDTVRVEFDGKAGTLSFAVNGQDLELGFSDVSGVISPSCGSYRSGVKIRLIKVEVFQSSSGPEDDDNLCRQPSVLHWQLPSELRQSRHKDVLCPLKDKKDKKEQFELSTPDVERRIISARGDLGVTHGIHEWSFEVSELSRSLLCFGITAGEVDAEQLLAIQADSFACAWHSDGTLWSSGNKINEHFGEGYFPLKKQSIVTMRLNAALQQVTFFVNGTFVGEAFNGSNIKALTPLNGELVYYPAASVTSPFQMIKLRPTGFNGSIVFPFFSLLRSSVSSSFARLSASLISGPLLDDKEVSLLPWLRSPLLVGGLDEQYLKESSHWKGWKSGWNNGEPTGSMDIHDPVASKRPSEMRRLSSLDVSIDVFISKIAQVDIDDENSSVCKLLEEWLNDTVEKDNPMLRAVLEKSKTYSFPRCERPFMAAMLKHGGLFQEAMIAVIDLQNGKPSTPSNDMKSLWKRVRQLRVYLRQQRQLIVSAESKSAEGDVSVISGASSGSLDLAAADDGATGTTAEVTTFPVEIVPETVPEKFDFYISSNITWIEQVNVSSVYSPEYSCKVLSIGIDYGNELLYVKFCVRGNNSMGTLQPAVDSTISIGSDCELQCPASNILVDLPESEISGCLRYELPTKFAIESLQTEEVAFSYGNSGYTAAVLNMTVSSESASTKTDGTPSNPSFHQICDGIEAKANFLLKLVYAGTAELSKTANQRSTSGDKSRASTPSSQEDNEKWKKVVEFLRIHTSLKREKSRVTSTTEETFMDDVEDDQFSTNAALKACALFVVNDGATSPALLLDIIQRRNLRVISRTYALEAISEMISCSDVVRDQQGLQEIFLYVKSSISSAVSASGAEISNSRRHYLNSLEGCSSSSLRQLQDAFLHVFSEVTETISYQMQLLGSHSFSLNSHGKSFFEVLHTLLSLWFMHFSSRDHKFLLESGILRLLYQLSSYSFYEKSVVKYLHASIALIQHKDTKPKDYHELKVYSKPYSASALSQNLVSGSLTLREVIFNMKMLPDSVATSSEKEGLGLLGDIHELMATTTPSETTTMFQNLIQILRKKEEEEKQRKETEAAGKARIEAEKYEAELARVKNSGIPLFDAIQKAEEVYLENFDQTAGIKATRGTSHVCSILANVCYDIEQGFTDSGNYFELTVLELGTRDIGVGLGAQAYFQLTGQMPGWEAHSFGYHGDDGKKFGQNATPGTWPLFETGSVIGCGLDFARRNIFYTLNGTLLGVGFTAVEDSELYPIIGFHGDAVSQKVSINFGVTPFEYTGPEVHVNAKSLIERETRRLQTLVDNTVIRWPASRMTDEARLRLSKNDIIYEDKVVEQPSEEQDPVVYEKTFQLLRYNLEAASRTMREVRGLRCFSQSMLRFLLALVCENDSALPLWNDHLTSDGSKHKPYTLARGRSTYGTPKYETYGDGAMLQFDICGFFMRELQQSAAYFAAYKKRAGYLFQVDSEASGTDHEMLETVQEIDSEVDLTGNGAITFSSAEGSVATVPDEFRNVLDVFEVDEAAYQYILGLRSVLQLSKQVKSILSKGEFVVDLLLLLEHGSARIRDVATHLMKIILPQLLPETVETALSRSVLACTIVSPTPHTLESTGSGRRSRKLPDSIVRSAFECVKKAVQLGNTAGLDLSYGQGSIALHCGAANAGLLHCLLEDASYSELLSCFLTDAVRNAEDAVSRLAKGGQIDLLQADIFTTATAAGFIMCGLTLKLSRGAQVLTDAGNTGVVLSYNQDDQVASILASNVFCGKHDIVELSKDEFRLVPLGLTADLSAMSQPLLPQLISLFKHLLDMVVSPETQNKVVNVNSTPHFWRLTSSLSLALYTLINSRQYAVIDAVQYAGIMFDVVSVSLEECALDHFVSASEALDMWMVCQARCLELDSSSAAVTTEQTTSPTDVTVELEGLQVQNGTQEVIVATDESPLSEVALDALQQLSVETYVSIEVCGQMLEYFMMDVDRTRSHLLTRAPTSSDSAPVAAAETKSSGDPLLAFVESQTALSNEVHSRYSPFEQGVLEETSNNALVFETQRDAATSSECRIGQLVQYHQGDIDAVASFFHTELGVQLSEIVRSSDLRPITKMYNCSSSNDLVQFMQRLDRSIVILHLREIVLNLLHECSINLSRDAPKLEDWIKLLKLSTLCADSKNKSKSIATLCSALLKATKSSLHESSLVTPGVMSKLLLDDVLQNFKFLMNPPKIKNGTKLVYKSPHPFIDNYIVESKIELPLVENGYFLTFDPKCGTPSESAVFSIFMSKEELDSNIPAHVFWGQPGTPTAFKSLHIPKNITCIYYRFAAKMGANKAPLHLTAVDGHAKFDDANRTVKRNMSAIRSGTGEEDSLSNFFEERFSFDTDISFVTAECDFFSHGTWFFEATYTAPPPDKRESLGSDFFQGIKIGLVDDAFQFSDTYEDWKHAFMITALGSFTSTLSELESFSELQGGDIIGCLFSISDSTVETKFAVNGKWTKSVRFNVEGSGVLPAFSVGGECTIHWNFGESVFSHPPVDPYLPINCRPGGSGKDAWGYEFSIEPLKLIPYSISRSFEQVWHSKGAEGTPLIYIWRPKAQEGYASVGDIITQTKQVPSGGVTIAKEFYRAPVDYELIFYCSKTNLAIWRPIPGEGYVSLGDVFYYSSDATVHPPKETCVCVPIWSVTPSRLDSRVYSDKIVKDAKVQNMSIWLTGTCLGHFRASKTHESTGIDKNLLHSLPSEIANEVTGEWFTEKDIATKPSLSWSCYVLEFLLQEKVADFDDVYSNEKIFSTLVEYISSNNCPSPFRLVPILIKFIRTAAELGHIIDINKLRPLCKSISNSMAAKNGDSKKSYGHQLLADLVVEYERYRLLDDVRVISKLLGNEEPSGFSYSPSWASATITAEERTAARLVEVTALKKMLGKDSTLSVIRNVLSFFYSLENDVSMAVIRNHALSADLIGKVWFDWLSLASMEESAHPHNLEKFSKTISIPGADKLMVTLDRRSDLLKGCSLLIEGTAGSSKSFLLSGGEDGDAFTKPIMFSGSEIKIVFDPSGVEKNDTDEVSAVLNNVHHWGWAVMVVAEGPAYESVRIRTKLADISEEQDSVLTPLLNADDAPASDAVPATPTAHTDTPAESNGHIAPVDTPALPAADRIGRLRALKGIPLELTDDVLAKVFEIGKLVDSNEISLPYDTEKNVEVKGRIAPKDTAVDPILYVMTFVYKSGDVMKTTRTVLGPSSFFKLTATGATTIAYTIHACFESTLKEIFIDPSKQEKPTEELKPPEEPLPVTPAPVVPAVVNTVMSGWACVVCTYQNAADVAECEMCFNARPGEAAPGEIQVTWFCRACTLLNTGTSPRCAACDVDRTTYETAAAATEETVVAAAESDTDSDLEIEVESGLFGTPLVTPPFSRTRDSILRAVLGGVLQARETTSFSTYDDTTSGGEKGDSVDIFFKGSYSEEQRFEIRLEKAMVTGMVVPASIQQHMRRWNAHDDNVLLDYINTQNLNTDELGATRISLPKQILTLYQAVSFYNFSVLDIYARALLFRLFNNIIKGLLPSLNLMNPDPSSLGAMVRRHNRYIFLNVKQPLLDTALEETQVSSGTGLPATLQLNNFKSLNSKEKNEIEPSKSQNCFVQAFTQLLKKESKIYKHIFSGDRVFQISFDGESGIDAGGIFREGMSRIIEDLFSESFNLLLLCPNGKHNVHINTDKYIPNPIYTGPTEIAMLEFIGKLMGTSMRAKMCLPFEFPSIVWKLLVGDELHDEDFHLYDAISYKQVLGIRNCDEQGVHDNASFDEHFDEKPHFVCLGSDGQIHELCPGGRSRLVTFDTRLDYYTKVVAYRLHEFDTQISAIKHGLEEVVPIHLLQLFSWQQLEILVCGNPAFDISLWKAHTDSDGVSSKTCALFWKVMESLTPKEQSGFVRFAWGRSRLPPEKQFTNRMRLTDGGRASLPVSHTCFFSVEMPAYETEEEMRRGLLTAIHFGVGGILMG